MCNIWQQKKLFRLCFRLVPQVFELQPIVSSIFVVYVGKARFTHLINTKVFPQHQFNFCIGEIQFSGFNFWRWCHHIWCIEVCVVSKQSLASNARLSDYALTCVMETSKNNHRHQKLLGNINQINFCLQNFFPYNIGFIHLFLGWFGHGVTTYDASRYV